MKFVTQNVVPPGQPHRPASIPHRIAKTAKIRSINQSAAHQGRSDKTGEQAKLIQR